MARKGKVDNLDPIRSKEVARERGANGGRKSGKTKRERKLMSQIYADFLAKRFKVEGKPDGGTGADLVGSIVELVLTDGGAPAVSLMKEIREATEGNKFTVDGGEPLEIKVKFE